MAIQTGDPGRLKSAHRIGGKWAWIDANGKLRHYSALTFLIAAAASEGWAFSRCCGPVGVFSVAPGR